jgi:hypothetical protein
VRLGVDVRAIKLKSACGKKEPLDATKKAFSEVEVLTNPLETPCATIECDPAPETSVNRLFVFRDTSTDQCVPSI